MDDNTANVMRTILRHAPCTKLCIKQHVKLSMSAVLRAVDQLAANRWIEINAYMVPQGGKPHSDIRPAHRALYGAAWTGTEWDVCALYLTGECDVTKQKTLPNASPLTVIVDKASGIDVPRHASTIDLGTGIAAYLHVQSKGIYIDEGLRLCRPNGDTVYLGALPSPLFQKTRLDYRQAFNVCTPSQKIRLRAELAVYVGTILQTKNVIFTDQTDVTPAQAAAWSSVWRVMDHL